MVDGPAIIQFGDILVVNFCGERFVAFVYTTPVGRALQKFSGLSLRALIPIRQVMVTEQWYSTVDVEELMGIVAHASVLTLKIFRFGA